MCPKQSLYKTPFYLHYHQTLDKELEMDLSFV